jgi:sporulation-control protein spo0M
MFDFLKGGKAQVRLEIDSPDQTYTAGKTIHAVVTVDGEKDLKIQQGRITLVCREEYQYRRQSTSRDSNGHRSTSVHASWGTDERTLYQQVFAGETVIPGATTQTFKFDMPIPPDATPTCADGKIVRVHWWLTGTLDRKLASDVQEKAEIRVLSILPHEIARPGEYGRSNEPDEAHMALVLPSDKFALGETITGELIVRPQKSFDVTEIRAELEMEEKVPRDEGNRFKKQVKVKLAGKTKLQPDQEQRYPFSMTIPANSPVTFKTSHSSATWTLRGVLARFMRGDTQVEGEIEVFSLRPA